MAAEKRLLALRVALIVFGLFFVLGFYPLTVLWPSGWTWGGMMHSHYLYMIVGVYATLGIFLLIAARDPLKHASLIWFTVWSSVVHGVIMAVQSFMDEGERGHLLGDVPALFILAIVFTVLMPRSARTSRA
jgi:FtsH-binding integral membrane protein